MRLRPLSTAPVGLVHYAELVAGLLGRDVLLTASHIDEKLASAIIVTGYTVPTLPEWGLILTWDEAHGWALRIKTSDDGDTTTIAYLGHDVLPSPTVVGEFVAAATRGEHPGVVLPPTFRSPLDDDNLEARLAGYAHQLPESGG